MFYLIDSFYNATCVRKVENHTLIFQNVLCSSHSLNNSNQGRLTHLSSPKRLFPRKYQRSWITSASVTFPSSAHISDKSCNHHPQDRRVWTITVLYNIHHLLVTHTNTSVFCNKIHSQGITNMSTWAWEPKPWCFRPQQEHLPASMACIRHSYVVWTSLLAPSSTSPT